MNQDYKISDIPEECIKQINELQEKLTSQTKEEIVLVAYRPAQGE